MRVDVLDLRTQSRVSGNKVHTLHPHLEQQWELSGWSVKQAFHFSESGSCQASRLAVP